MDIITFDLDETLIHAKRCHWHAFNDAFEKFGQGIGSGVKDAINLFQTKKRKHKS